ncbi:hypothetical protein D0863_04305 [Hortaea werneckii]|uniref:Uncharacterized protein n=1 Tax=Hortaea werneckii TaxID=91943 RepID=A0A3M7E8S0_HORWE|nr:hypothetical protein D0863_04305 [Hortaea werneckii]
MANMNQERSEKTPICAQYLPGEKRKVFHFPKKIALTSREDLNDIEIFSKNYHDDSGNKNTMKLHWRGPESSLKAGDELYVSWELMDEYIEHPAPAFPMGRIGCWSNWHEIGRLGLKVTFKRSGSTQWYAMYVQYNSVGKAPMAEGVPGATKAYAYGTAMLAFLQNTTWGQKPPWIPYFGVPNMVEVQVDRFREQAVCRPVTPSETLPNITYQPGTAVKLLSSLRVRDNNGAAVGDEQLQNVDGTFAKFDLSWAPGWAKLSLSNRKRCDRDFFGHLSDQVDYSCNDESEHSSCKPKKDNQGRDTNQCIPCFLRGLPCSWTRPDWVGGPNWHKTTASPALARQQSARTFSGPFWDLYYESVFGKLTPRSALEPKEIPDPGYAPVLQDPEGGMAEDDAMEDEPDKEVDEVFNA